MTLRSRGAAESYWTYSHSRGRLLGTLDKVEHVHGRGASEGQGALCYSLLVSHIHMRARSCKRTHTCARTHAQTHKHTHRNSFWSRIEIA